jgi:hypothetical protein
MAVMLGRPKAREKERVAGPLEPYENLWSINHAMTIHRANSSQEKKRINLFTLQEKFML